MCSLKNRPCFTKALNSSDYNLTTFDEADTESVWLPTSESFFERSRSEGIGLDGPNASANCWYTTEFALLIICKIIE